MRILFLKALQRAFRPAVISLLFIASVPTTALAQNRAQAIKGCLDETLSDVEKVELLAAMENWRIVFTAFVEENAAACFTKLTGQPAKFVNNTGFIIGEAGLMALEAASNLAAAEKAERLEREAAEEAARLEREAISEEAVRSRICEILELVTQYDKTINEAEAARQDRRIETLSATVQECSSWYDDSPKEALTNDICNSIFAAGGLPNSTISGPSQSELLLAELSKQNAETELEILVASGMLLEDFTAQYKSDETEDVYGCDQ